MLSRYGGASREEYTHPLGTAYALVVAGVCFARGRLLSAISGSK